jgi:diguanylate cyclase (GGDEF)-like protein/PAS domain S-box-containing protein
MDEFLRGSSYHFSWYAVPFLVVGGLNWLLGLATLRRERGSSVTVTFLAMTFAIGEWLLCQGGAYLTHSADVAFIWVRLSMIGAIFIPVTVVTHAAIVVSQFRAARIAACAGTFISTVLTVLLFRTDWVVTSAHHYFWGYYAIYGSLGPLLIAYFIGFLAIASILYDISYKRAKSGTHLRRMKVVRMSLWAAGPAFVDFLPAMHVGVYPFGYLFMFAFVVLATFIVWRYRLVDITPALAARQVIDTMAEGLLVADREGLIRLANPAAATLWPDGRKLAGSACSDLDLQFGAATLTRLLDPDVEDQLEVTSQAGDGPEYTVVLSSSKLLDHLHEWVGTVYIVHDVTERKRSEEEIRYLAFHDSLTGAATRPVMMDRLTESLARARRTKTSVGVVFVDLDGFKYVNDTEGHDTGDELLRRVASELGAILREGDTLARVGGDEFVLLLPDIGSAEDARIVAGRVLQCLGPGAAKDGARRVSASLGIALFPADGAEADALLRNADRAMYAAKRAGGNTFKMSGDLVQELLDAPQCPADDSDARRLVS